MLLSCIDNIDIADGNSGDDDDDIDRDDDNNDDDDDDTSLQASRPSTTLPKSMPP